MATPLQPGEMLIGELAERSGVSTATINFYVKDGLLPPPRKLNRTRAAYSELHVRALRLIKRCQNAIGMSLAEIKAQFELVGLDEQGIERAERIGILQALPPVWGDATREPIEHFDPVPRDAFAKLCGVDPALVEHLLAHGVLRPRHAGLFDAGDAWLVRTIAALLADGIELSWLDFTGELVGPVAAMCKVLQQLTVRHQRALTTREMTFRDLTTPFMAVVSYLISRIHDERFPDWRRRIRTRPTDAEPE